MSRIDYDLSLIKAVAFDIDGVLSPATVPLDDQGIPRRMTNIHDGYAIYHAIKRGLKIVIISGAESDVTRARMASLGISDIFMGKISKIDVLKTWMHENSLYPENIAFVGDDVPDAECMAYAGLSVAPADASPDIKMHAKYITLAKGGYGVARELLEQVMKCQGIWPQPDKAFG